MFATISNLKLAVSPPPSALMGKYTVKKVSDIPIPSRDVTYQTLPGRENVANLFYGVVTSANILTL